jgi:hypothetical protein
MWLTDTDFRELRTQAELRIDCSQDQSKWPVHKFIALCMFVLKPD